MRASSTVLREARGEIPLAYSPSPAKILKKDPWRFAPGIIKSSHLPGSLEAREASVTNLSALLGYTSYASTNKTVNKRIENILIVRIPTPNIFQFDSNVYSSLPSICSFFN